MVSTALKGERSDHSPSLAYFNGKFYIAWTGTDHYHHVNVMSTADGKNWGNKKTFTTSPGPATSKDGPCLLVAKNRLYLAWSGGGHKRLLQLMSKAYGDDWDPKDEDPLKGERSDHSPSLAYFNGKFYIAWTGTDHYHHVNVMSSEDGVHWGNKKTFTTSPGPATSKDGPCLLVAKNRLYLAWSGGGDERLLQLMSTADGARHWHISTGNSTSPGRVRISLTIMSM
jgi:ethanolamine utilization protein EutP (predicted NTPase)